MVFEYLNEMFVYRWDIWLVGRWLRWGCQNSKTWTLFSSATRLSTGISRKCSRWKVTRLRQIDRIYRYNFMQLFGQIIKVRTKHSKKLIYEPLFLIDYIYLMYHANNCNYKPTKTQFFCSGSVYFWAAVSVPGLRRVLVLPGARHCCRPGLRLQVVSHLGQVHPEVDAEGRSAPCLHGVQPSGQAFQFKWTRTCRLKDWIYAKIPWQYDLNRPRYKSGL